MRPHWKRTPLSNGCTARTAGWPMSWPANNTIHHHTHGTCLRALASLSQSLLAQITKWWLLKVLIRKGVPFDRTLCHWPALSVSPPRRPLPLAAVNGGTGAERSSGVEWTDDETRESERGRWSELVSLLVVEAFVLALNCTCCKLQPKDWGLPCMWCTGIAWPPAVPCGKQVLFLSCVGLPLPRPPAMPLVP